MANSFENPFAFFFDLARAFFEIAGWGTPIATKNLEKRVPNYKKKQRDFQRNLPFAGQK